MSEDQIKQRIFEKLRARMGDEYVSANAGFLEEQWQYLVEVGMLDPETDTARPTETS